MTDSRPHRRPPRRFGSRAAETAVFGVLVNFGRNSKEKGRLPRSAISYKHLVIYEQSSYTFIYSAPQPVSAKKNAHCNCQLAIYRGFLLFPLLLADALKLTLILLFENTWSAKFTRTPPPPPSLLLLSQANHLCLEEHKDSKYTLTFVCL